MTDKKTQSHSAKSPVIYVHAKNRKRVGHDDIKPLLKLALPLYSRLPFKGVEQTVYGYDQPVSLLAELARRHPHSAVIFLRAGLYPTRHDISRLMRILQSIDQPAVLTILSNAAPELNPFAGLHTESPESCYDLSGLVRLLAPGHLNTLSTWPDHFTLLSIQAVKVLSAVDGGHSLLQSLQNACGNLMAPDDLFLPDPGNKVFTALQLKPHESVHPPAFGELSARLQDWISAGIIDLPINNLSGREVPVHTATLHVTHSWGGGVALWIKSFIEADHHALHFQLRSEEPRSSQGYGQKLSLYAGNELRCPVASWWLQPVISSIVDKHENYQAILAEICRRYGIGRVLVSSLIGHSLDVLRSSLPTLQILHDHFPIWPLLGVHPGPYLQENNAVNLSQALLQHAQGFEFPDKDVSSWENTRAAYLQAMNDFGIKIVAPGKSVLDLQIRLEPAFESIASQVIPHGFPALPGRQAIVPRSRSDGRLRMVVLGRMQAGKGQRLLSLALHKLAQHVQVYLLGTGKSGETFFGCPGVNVILNYKRAELASLLANIGPDFAALLSVVPETFSYTLSELQALGIPAIATRTGSFPDRISNGRTGWLIDADADALVSLVAALCRQPEQIAAVRLNLPPKQVNTSRKMVNAYNRFCVLAEPANVFIPGRAGAEIVQWSAADYLRSMSGNELQRVGNEREKLKREVEKRTDWALNTTQELKHEQTRREKWVRATGNNNRALDHAGRRTNELGAQYLPGTET